MNDSQSYRFYRKETYIKNYTFLKDFFSKDIYETICSIMEHKRVTKKRYPKDINIRIDDLFYILALWQLKLYERKDYIKDRIIKQINDYLIDHSSLGKLKRQGYISYKDIQRAESDILTDLHANTFNLTPKYFQSFSEEALNYLDYYNKFLSSFELYIPEEWPAYEKMKNVRKKTSRPLPGQVFVWVMRKELAKSLLYTVAKEFKVTITENNSKQFNRAIDTIYVNYYVTGVGDIIALCVVMLDIFKDKSLRIPKNLPKNFNQRLKQYKKRYSPMIEYLLESG